jgi:hypothetical protein
MVWYLGMLSARHNVAGMHSAWYTMPYKTADNETADAQNGRNSKLQKAQNGT